MRHLPVLLILALLAGGCLDERNGGGSVAGSLARDSAGIVIIDNGQQPLERWRLEPRPRFAVGAADGRVELIFSHVVGAVRFSDGRIAVADAHGRDVRILSPDGQFLTRTGGRGDRPGQFMAVTWFGRAGRDTLAVFDAAIGRVSLFADDGRLIDTWPVRLPDLSAPPDGLALQADRSLLALGRRAAVGDASGFDLDTLLILRLPRDSGPVAILERAAAPDVFRYVQPSEGGAVRRVSLALPFGRSVHAAAASDRYIFGDNGSYQLRVVGTTGSADRLIRRRHPPVTADHGARQRALQAQLDSLPERARAFHAEARAALQAALPERSVVPPEFRPPFDEVRFGDDGTIWVRLVAEVGSGPTAWDVFSPGGQYLARLEIPASLTPLQFASDHLLALTVDPRGVTSVVGHSILRER
jgi:hypothetical protein